MAKDKMTVRVGRDTMTPALKKLARNTRPISRRMILRRIGNDLVNEIKGNILDEKQYDGKPMKSPASDTKCNGRFAEDYKWRYLKSYRKIGRGEGRRQSRVTKSGKTEVRGRVPVNCNSKQLQHTGGTLKGIGMISVDSNGVLVGAKTGHARKILSYHNPTRKPLGISKEFADKARKKAFKLIMKGV